MENKTVDKAGTHAEVVVSPAKKSKQGDNSEGSEINLQSLHLLLLAMSSKLDSIQAQLSINSAEVQNVKARTEGCEKRLDEVESRTGRLEDEMIPISPLTQKVKDLEAALIDQENRSRRNNLRFLGIPEGIEKETPEEFLQQWIPKALQIQFKVPLEVQRAHRIPTRMSGERADKPRPLIAYFLRYSQVHEILQAAKKKGKIEFCGHSIMVVPDYARATAQTRKKFLELRPRLKSLSYRYGLLYPARMLLTKDDRHWEFLEPKDLIKFLEDREATSPMEAESGEALQTSLENRGPEKKKEWAALFGDRPRRDKSNSKERRRNRSPRRGGGRGPSAEQELLVGDLRSPRK